MADPERTPNRQLAYYQARAGFSNADLARAVTRRARAIGEAHICPDGSRVRRWLRGEMPREPVPGLLAEAFTERLGLPVSVADLGLIARGAIVHDDGIHLPWLLTRTISSLTQHVKGDLMLDRHAFDDDESREFSTGADLLSAVQLLTA